MQPRRQRACHCTSHRDGEEEIHGFGRIIHAQHYNLKTFRPCIPHQLWMSHGSLMWSSCEVYTSPRSTPIATSALPTYLALLIRSANVNCSLVSLFIWKKWINKDSVQRISMNFSFILHPQWAIQEFVPSTTLWNCANAINYSKWNLSMGWTP